MAQRRICTKLAARTVSGIGLVLSEPIPRSNANQPLSKWNAAQKVSSIKDLPHPFGRTSGLRLGRF